MKIFFNSNAVFGILVMRFTQVDLNNVLQVYALISTYLKTD